MYNNKVIMSGVNVKEVINEIYEQGLTLGLASGLSMVLAKLMKTSLGTPTSLKSFLLLAVSLGLGSSLLKVVAEKFKVPTELFEK